MSTDIKAALPKFTMKQLLEAGVHFGHKTMRWNPAMAPYIFGEKNGIHIINLQKTVPFLYQAMEEAFKVAEANGRILFVSTKRQASSVISEAASRCGQYYVNHRWLGGMLTNWHTVSKSIRTLQKSEEALNDPELQVNMTKKELLQLSRKRDKLELSLGGIRDMGGLPDLIFVVDTNKEHISIKEANLLGIPVIGVLDTNSNPEGVDFPIPGNDDSTRSITLYSNLIADAILAGIQTSAAKSGADIGEKVEAKSEEKTATSTKAKSTKKAAANDEKEKGVKEESKDKEKAEKKADTKAKSNSKKAPAKKTSAKATKTAKKVETDSKTEAKSTKEDKPKTQEKASEESAAPEKKAASGS